MKNETIRKGCRTAPCGIPLCPVTGGQTISMFGIFSGLRHQDVRQSRSTHAREHQLGPHTHACRAREVQGDVRNTRTSRNPAGRDRYRDPISFSKSMHPPCRQSVGGSFCRDLSFTCMHSSGIRGKYGQNPFLTGFWPLAAHFGLPSPPKRGGGL